MNEELGRMCKLSAVICFEVVYQFQPEETEEKHEDSQSA
jgi:hypothetical protein